MTEYRYVMQDKDGSCLYLSENGLTPQPKEFLKQLKDEGFQYAEERQFGASTLRIMTRDISTGTTTGAVVRTDPFTGQKHIF